MSDPITFADALHDFGLITYSINRWEWLPDDQWDAILEDARRHDAERGTSWWYPLFCKVQRNAKVRWECSTGNPQYIIPKDTFLPIPTWLLEHDRTTTYFGTVPADIVGVVLQYLRRDARIDVEYSTQTITTLYGYRHSFHDAPAVTTVDGNNCAWIWYRLDEICRADNKPAALDTFRDTTTATWYSNGVPVRSWKRLGPSITYNVNPGDAVCRRGDGSEMDKQFDAYLAPR